MWYNGTVTAARKLRIAYNHSFRRLFGIPENNSASEMFRGVELGATAQDHSSFHLFMANN